MPLDNLIKEYSLRTISDKTNISVNSLKKLQNREWEKLQKPQVVGFLKILEREYNLDLSDLRAEADSYYSEHKHKDNNNPIDIVDAVNVKSESKIVSGIVTIITIAVVAYAIWYYFLGQREQLDQNTTQERSTGMFEETLSGVKNILGLQSSNTQSLQNSEANTTSASSSKERSKAQLEQNVSAKESKSQAAVTTTTEQSEPATPTTPTQESAQSRKFNTVVEEANSTTVVTNTTTEKNSTLQNDVSVEANNTQELNSSAALNSDDNSSTQESASEDTQSVDTNLSQSAVAETNSSELISDPQEDNTTAVTISSVTIKPLAKRLWLGVYDLESKKRVNKFITSSMELPVNSKLAIITGHNKLEITPDSGSSMRFSHKGRVYLLVSQEGIKQISKREYKQITKNRAW